MNLLEVNVSIYLKTVSGYYMKRKLEYFDGDKHEYCEYILNTSIKSTYENYHMLEGLHGLDDNTYWVILIL